MPKKKRLKLNELTVKSFVTRLGDQSRAVKGGAENTVTCPTGTVCESCEGTCETCFYGPTCATWCAATCETCDTCVTCNTCGGNTCPYSKCQTCDCSGDPRCP